MEKAFNTFYSEVSPFVVVGLSMLYFVARNVFFVPHILISGWLLIGCMISIQIVKKLIQKGWLLCIVTFIRQALSKTWVAVLLGIQTMRNNWIGRVCGLFAMTNLLFFFPWIYYNVDLFAWIRSTCVLVFQCFESLFDPVALLNAFDTWKDTVPVLGMALTRGTVYVDTMLKACQNGDVNVLIIIPFVTFVILCCAILAYAISNLQSVIPPFTKFPDLQIIFILAIPFLCIAALISIKTHYAI